MYVITGVGEFVSLLYTQLAAATTVTTQRCTQKTNSAAVAGIVRPRGARGGVPCSLRDMNSYPYIPHIC